MSSARIELDLGDMADAVAASVRAECESASVSVHDGTITIELEPQDVPHLRASLNSLLRLLQASHDVLGATR